MPITQAELSYPELKRLTEDGHICAECGGRLTLAWDKSKYVLRCGTNAGHDGITIHDKEYEKRIEEARMATDLTTIGKDRMLARVNMAKFPQDLTPPEKAMLVQVAMTYGLDPLMSEVTIYQGRPYVSIDGRYRKAQETGNLDGVSTRPASKQEREEWQIPEGDYSVRADVFVKGAGHPFTGWGRVFVSETRIRDTHPGDAKKPTVTNPQRMAEKRAEAQALRKAFHINLPSWEDIGGPEEERQVVEGEVVEPPEVRPPEASQQVSEATTGPTSKPGNSEATTLNHEAKTPDDHGKPLTLGKVLTWVASKGKQYDRAWFFKNQTFFKSGEAPTEKQLEQAMTDICSMTGWDGI